MGFVCFRKVSHCTTSSRRNKTVHLRENARVWPSEFRPFFYRTVLLHSLPSLCAITAVGNAVLDELVTAEDGKEGGSEALVAMMTSRQ